jgi:hypothetical protein
MEKKLFYRKKSPPKRDGKSENKPGNMKLKTDLLGKHPVNNESNSGPSLLVLDYRRVKKYIT